MGGYPQERNQVLQSRIEHTTLAWWMDELYCLPRDVCAYQVPQVSKHLAVMGVMILLIILQNRHLPTYHLM